jgi:HEAT repeat protein
MLGLLCALAGLGITDSPPAGALRSAAPRARPTGSPLPRPGRRIPASERDRRRILNALRSEDPKRRTDAAWEAGQRRLRAAYKPLRALVRDDHPAVRRSAAYALGRLGRRDAAILLYDQIVREKKPAVIAALAVALGRLGYRTARPRLAGLTWSRNSTLRAAGIAALGYLGDPEDVSTLRRFLKSRDPGLRQSAVQAFGHLGQVSALPLVRPLLDDPSPAVQAATVEALAQLDARSDADAVARLADHPVAAVREAVVIALRTLGRPRHLDVLRKRLADRRPAIAAEAALSVARLGGSIPLERLLALLGSRHNGVRLAAARAAGLSGSRKAIPALTGLLAHPYLALRVAAIRALGRLAAYQSKAAILERLHEERGAARAALLEALGRLRAVQAAAAVVPLLSDSDPVVVAAAARALAGMARLDPRPLSSLGRHLAPLLQPRRHPAVLTATAAAFSMTRPQQARPGFVRLLRLTFHQEPAVRAAATRALGRFGDRLARPALRRLRADDSVRVRIEAILARARLPHRRGPRRPGVGRRRAATLGLPRCESLEQVVSARCHLAKAMARREPTSAQRAAIRRALHGRPNTRERAALVPLLWEVDRAWTRDLVRGARRSPCYLVRAAALRALSIWPPRVIGSSGGHNRTRHGRASPTPRDPLSGSDPDAPGRPKLGRRAPAGPGAAGGVRPAAKPDAAHPFSSEDDTAGCGCQQPARGGGFPVSLSVWVFLLLGIRLRHTIGKTAGPRAHRGPSAGISTDIGQALGYNSRDCTLPQTWRGGGVGGRAPGRQKPWIYQIIP